MQKESLKAWLSFTRKERNAALLLVLLVVLLFCLPNLIPVKEPEMLEIDKVTLEQWEKGWETKDSLTSARKEYVRKKEYPRPYYKPHQPYQPYQKNNNYQSYNSKSSTWKVIDINKADSSDLLPLPGIGPRLAARIIAFRDKLGGFYDIEQIRETYGLPDSTFQLIRHRLKIEEPVARININKADISTLRQHPYIRWALANAILQYRNQHEPFQSPEELTRIHLCTPDIMKKLSPYLATTDQ